jgi:hypothetical protein
MSAFEQTIMHLPIILTVFGSPLPLKTQDLFTAIYTSPFIGWRHKTESPARGPILYLRVNLRHMLKLTSFTSCARVHWLVYTSQDSFSYIWGNARSTSHFRLVCSAIIPRTEVRDYFQEEHWHSRSEHLANTLIFTISQLIRWVSQNTTKLY